MIVVESFNFLFIHKQISTHLFGKKKHFYKTPTAENAATALEHKNMILKLVLPLYCMTLLRFTVLHDKRDCYHVLYVVI